MLEDYRNIGAEVWKRFKRGRREQLWYFNELLKVYGQKCPNRRLVEELKRVITELTQLSKAE